MGARDQRRDRRGGVPGPGRSATPRAPTSWGLTETALEEIAESAPVRAFLARVGALYPEYHVRTMPADALEPDGIPGAMSAARDGGESRVAVAVANAAVHGDDFKWHLDMDPADLDPASPFAERYGVYVNRAKARPLFVSALVPQRTRAVDSGSRRGDALPRPRHRHGRLRSSRAGPGAAHGPGRPAPRLRAVAIGARAPVLAGAQAVSLPERPGDAPEHPSTGVGRARRVRDGGGKARASRRHGRRGAGSEEA